MSLRARGDDAETVRARLLARSPDGIEELDFEEEVELAVYVPDAVVEDMLQAFPGAVAQPLGEGWEDAWRAFHQPVEVGGLWVGPPWEDAPAGARTVVIDPGRAFGTGGHPTTRLALELLARRPERGSLLDVGCGSGVLAIAAARLGFGPIRAIDLDPVAVETTIENAKVNGVDLEASVVDAANDPLPAADVATVNVLLRPVERILRRLDATVAITSGYLDGERPSHTGWVHDGHRAADGWAADAFVREGGANRLPSATV